MRFEFLNFVLDSVRGELLHGEEPVDLEPKVMAFLALLLERRGELVTKQELLDALWPGTAVTEGSLTRVVSLARAALGARGAGSEIIRTRHRRGYQIAVPVEVRAFPVPGFERRLATYEVDPRTALLVQRSFVGREVELTRLAQRFDAARDGRGGLAMLVGEPGIGKTRTLEELAARARREGATVLWGRSFEGEGAEPFAPFAEALGDHAKQTPVATLEKELGSHGPALSVLVPGLRERLPELPVPVPLQPDAERQRLLDAVAQVLLATSERAPVLLVLDDLHWAEAGTIAMLRHVARFAGRGRVLLAGTYRDVELDRHPLADALVALKRETEYERIALRGLAEAEVARFLEAIGAREVPAALVHAIHVETEGNPLFIREVLLHLEEQGKLKGADGCWRSEFSVEELGIPEGVRQVIGRRLSRLSEGANRLLSAASGFQGPFHFEVAARAAGLPEAAALDALDDALDAQLARATDEDEVYDFSHVLTRHTLYAELSPSRQVRLHRRIAAEMERVWGERAAEHAGEIARQWHRSAALPGAEQGVRHGLLAAERAEKAAAHQEAATHLRMALELLPAGDPLRPRVRGRLALALAWSLELEEAALMAGEAAEGIAASEGSGAAADFLASAATVLWGAARSPLAWRLARQGLRHAGTHRDRAWAILKSHEIERREWEDPEGIGFPIEFAEEEKEVASILGEDVGDLRALGLVSTPSLTRAEILARGTSFCIEAAFVVGEYRRSLALFEEDAARWLGRGALVMAVQTVAVGARVHLALGDVASADAWYAKAVALAERAGNPPSLGIYLLAYPAERIWFVGELGAFEAFAAPLWPTIDDPPIENRWAAAPIWAFAAYARAVLGQAEGALRYLERARRAIECGAGRVPNYTPMVCWAAATVWELERSAWAPLLESQLLTKTIAGDYRYPATDARLAMAWMCALQGRFDEAAGWFAKARAVLDEQGARPLRTITDFEEARMFARRGARGDAKRALPLLDTAVRQFEAIGMPGWTRRAQALRRDLGGR